MIRRRRPGFRSPWRRERARAGHRRGFYGPTPSFTLQELACDDQALDLAGAFAYSAELDVAIELFDRIILGETVAAVDLHRLVGGAHRDLRSKQLGHGRLLGDALPVVLHPSSTIGEQ